MACVYKTRIAALSGMIVMIHRVGGCAKSNTTSRHRTGADIEHVIVDGEMKIVQLAQWARAVQLGSR